MQMPYIICHMVTSIDGKVSGDFLFKPECEKSTEIYYQVNREYKADAFACGRITMSESFTGSFYPDLTAFEGVKIPRLDYVADKDAKYFAVAFDRRGKLGWKSSRISDEDPGYNDSHVIEIMCEDTPDSYLAYLQSIKVSYIFAGKNEIDLKAALVKLKEIFGIKTLLLEGGSAINGVFERENLIDELSLVVAPIVAQESGKPLFENAMISNFCLKDSKVYENGVLWLNYKKV